MLVSCVEKDTKGITAEKDEFGEWFSQLMLKADLADYTAVSGAIVFKPRSYAIWEKIKAEVDARFKKAGIKNCYFPMFIPESVLAKEVEHIEGFAPEVAWVTHAGNKKLNERLAVRPTSETIMYESFSKWIRSWRDLPLRLNQWNNVVRWEFKHPVPFLRTREFLWNEGHTAFASEQEALGEENEIIGIYKEVCEKLLALPSLPGRKSEKEKFAGAVFSTSLEFVLPNGKAVQGPDFHHDGQNFAKAYNITFLNKNGEKEYVWQNTFAISTRMLGVMFAIHSDEKGLIIPPALSPEKVVVVPILFESKRKEIEEFVRKVEKHLPEERVVDWREHKPGFKFNEWELKGIPLRVEVGPKEVEQEQVVLVRRDTHERKIVNLSKLAKEVNRTLDDIQRNLFARAQKLVDHSLVEAESFADLERAIKEKKIALAPMCKNRECEDELKFKTSGAKVLNIPFEQPKNLSSKKCVICKSQADYLARVGKSY
ncbi:proline--tRNA ligase [Candidatus Pacearchaeota archaeon]|nr:MAG: proline--tRNA ligase [Candidatus Pacearchaeota archaeon]